MKNGLIKTLGLSLMLFSVEGYAAKGNPFSKPTVKKVSQTIKATIQEINVLSDNDDTDPRKKYEDESVYLHMGKINKTYLYKNIDSQKVFKVIINNENI